MGLQLQCGGSTRGWWWGGEDEVLAFERSSLNKAHMTCVTLNEMSVKVKVKDVGLN